MVCIHDKKSDGLTLNKRLAFLRKNMKLSQADAANKIGVSDKVLSKWETGVSNPEISNLNLIKDFYNVSLDYLINGIPASKEEYYLRDTLILLDKTSDSENELLELIKPYGRFSTEDRKEMFLIENGEVLVNVQELIKRSDFDLFNLLAAKYKFFRKNKNNYSGSILDRGKSYYILPFPYKLEFNDVVYTTNIEFYELALKSLEEKIKEEEKNKKFKQSRGIPLGVMQWTDKKSVLSQALEKVQSIYSDNSADRVMLFLLNNGAVIQKKEPYKYTEGYEIIDDMAQTNMLRRILESNLKGN